MEGWIKLHRKMLGWEFYRDTNTKVVFLHLLLNANYEDKTWRGIEIKRGQLITSVKHLSEELNLSTQQIRTSLNKLKDNKQNNKQITIKTTNKYTLVTIEKYDLYQSYDDYLTNKQQTNQQTNQQQHKNIKEYKNKKIYPIANFNQGQLDNLYEN